jgi:hypothetical protein
MPGGYHNGFNPFRDAHGRWATPGGAGVEHAQQPSKGSGNMNAVIRSASGRATGGGGGGSSKPPATGGAAHDPKDPKAVGLTLNTITPTAQGGVKGAGKYPLADPEQGGATIGRYVSPHASPESDTPFKLGATDAAELDKRGFAEVVGKNASAVLSGTDAVSVREGLSLVAVDLDGKGTILKSYFDANGLTPKNPTTSEFNDLLATSYKGETLHQSERRSIRLSAYALALGERDFATDMLDRTSFGADFGAQSIAQEMGTPTAGG